MTLAQGQQDKSQTAASLELEKENSRMCNIYTKAIFLMQELSKSVRTMPAISRARARERERERNGGRERKGGREKESER